jgi:hypothetical protein
MTIPKRENHGVLHRVAKCENCDWNDSYAGAGDSIERVARTARRHCEVHGHRVSVESGSSFDYVPYGPTLSEEER